MTFADFVQHYQLARSEGIVLRYLAGAYKALHQTVPDEAKTDELQDLIAWLGELVRQVDSSLLDEWEQLANPDDARWPRTARSRPRRRRSPRNRRAFRVLVRNALFRRVELAALRRYGDLGELDARGRLGRAGLGGRDGRRTSPSTATLLHRRRRARAGAAAGGRAGRTAGGSGRSSTTRPATTTGASAPRSTWPASDEAGRAAVHVLAVDRLDDRAHRPPGRALGAGGPGAAGRLAGPVRRPARRARAPSGTRPRSW